MEQHAALPEFFFETTCRIAKLKERVNELKQKEDGGMVGCRGMILGGTQQFFF